jgi:hypothetical protein
MATMPSRSLCIDHDHKNMQVRGLLCDRCNTALGLFFDDAALLRTAADYLEGKLAFDPEELQEAARKERLAKSEGQPHSSQELIEWTDQLRHSIAKLQAARGEQS